MLASVHQFLSQLNRCDDPRISSATADVPFHGPSNLGLAGMRSFFQQPNARDDHARRTVAALHRVGLNKCLLPRVKPAVLSNALDGSDLFSGNGGCRSDARAHRRSVYEHGTSAALALAASIFAA